MMQWYFLLYLAMRMARKLEGEASPAAIREEAWGLPPMRRMRRVEYEPVTDELDIHALGKGSRAR